MDFRMLGPLEVRADERVLPLGGAKQRIVLALLLLRADEVVPVERLRVASPGPERADPSRSAWRSATSSAQADSSS